jgi:DNA-binding Xre family transcriptional regulator
MAISGGMQNNEIKAQHCVAIRFASGKPSLLKSSYPWESWKWMIHRAIEAKDIDAKLIMDDTDEGKAIVDGTDLSALTEEYLLGLDAPGEDNQIRALAAKFGIELKPVSQIDPGRFKGYKASIALKICAAIKEGVKPAAGASV